MEAAGKGQDSDKFRVVAEQQNDALLLWPSAWHIPERRIFFVISP